jgi:uncharacterized YigZ family protein
MYVKVNRYKTVLNEAMGELVEKKSKFFATVKPVSSEEEAQKFIDITRKKYADANHNVFAYVIGSNNEIQRYSDDGEPSGTAGLPILDLLKGEEIKNVAIVVTRYFGGTLLGTGGLVRAYSHCAKEGLNQSEIIEKVLYHKIEVTVDYTLSGKLQYYINENEPYLIDTLYVEAVTFVVLVEVEQVDNFCKDIKDITSGKGQVELKELVYGALVKNQMKVLDTV